MLFEVTADEIARLNQNQLPALLRKLLILESQKFGIPLSSVNVARQVLAPDGGIDGSIKWEGDLERTDYIPQKHVVFQCKATDMTPTSAGNEVKKRWKRNKARSR